MEDLVRTGTEWAAIFVEGAAVLVVVLAAVESVWRSLVIFVGRPAAEDAAKGALRLHLARWLAIALELALAADILRTAVAPSWEDIGKLAAIAVLRTLLNFFLQREIEIAARQEARDAPAR